jgi:nitrogen fixation protein NifX
MKIAFATTDGGMIDEHFGRAGTFAIYDITAKGHQFLELRRFGEGMDRSVTDTKGRGPLHDSAVERKVARLSDCKLVYLTEIGGPSAARLVRKGILPMKMKDPVRIDRALSRLLDMIRNSPPPWIRKAMSADSE